MPSYTDYQPTADANTAASPIGAPEGNYQGRWVNDTFRWLMAAVRNLGDTTPKIPTGGNPLTPVGTMAYQNASAVAITGGAIAGVLGYMPIRSVIDYAGTLTQALALEPSGWAVCDGRTVNGIVTPDLRGRFVRGFWSGTFESGATGGTVADQTTSSSGSHTHGSGSTGSHVLTLGQMPGHYHNEGSYKIAAANFGATEFLDVSDGTALRVTGSTSSALVARWRTGAVGNNEAHSHTIASGGAHTHTVPTPVPPYYVMVKLMRVA